ncbi:MAG: DUF126 domain-containing protein [Nitrososphaerales archaeon]
MSSKTYKCHVLVKGKASGEALFSRQAFSFDRAVDPRTGVVADSRSGMAGANIRGNVLFYTRGKGSTAGSSWLLEAIRLGNGPAAIVTEHADLAAVVGASVAGILYGKAIPVLSGIDAQIFWKARGKTKSVASVDGSAARVVLTG